MTELAPPPSEEKLDNRKRYYVYSTLSTSMTYATYAGHATAENDMPTIISRIEIKGGAGVARAGVDRVHTPRGVVTEVTAEQIRELMTNDLFKRHLKNKFISVDEVEVHPEVQVGKGMEQRDNSAQIVPQDFVDAKENEAKPMEKDDPKIRKPGFLDRLTGGNPLA